jgi:peptide/nickel transport system substrate-binding protein
MEEGENLRFKKAILLLLVMLLSCGLLLGCGSDKEVQTEKDKVPQELVIGIGRDFYDGPETGNFLHPSTGVWESLTYPGEDLEPVKQLATKITADNTNKVWTVILREGVKFHDDSSLNADAVVKSVMRLKNNPKLDSYDTFPNLDKVEAVDEKTVKFTFNRPEPAFAARVAGKGCPIFSIKSFDEQGKVTHPYGTGPFKFNDYKKGDKLVITRNNNYWGKKAKLEKVTFKTVPDPSTRLAALTTGEIDAIVDVGGVLPEQASTIKDDKNMVLLTQPVTTSHYIIFNNKKEPFKDKNLRKAVSLSLDRKQLVDKVLSGYGDPADTIYTPLAKKWVTKGLWKTDKAKAKELAKVDKAQKVELVVNAALANRWPYKSIAEILQSELKAFNLDVEIKMVEGAAWGDTLKKGEYDMTLSPYTLMTGDPDFYFGQWIDSKGQMNKARGIGYSNSEADRLVAEAATGKDMAARQKAYKELEKLVAEDVPVAPIYNDVCIYAMKKNVKDLKIDPFFKPSLEKAYRGQA